MGTAGNGITPPLGCLRLFRLMACINPVMVDATYDRRHIYCVAG
jgi:hypothetical protein